MKNKLKMYGKGLILFGVCALFVLGAFSFKRVHFEKMQQKYSKEIDQYVNQELDFNKDAWQDEVDKMTAWIENKYVSDADRGLLYERISNVYKFQNDSLLYYENLGYALYYLDASGKVNTAVNIYADLANYYITNDSYEKAEEMLDEINKLCNIKKLDDLAVKSYVYRLQGIVLEHNGNHEQALKKLSLAEQAMDESHTGIYEKPYYAMIDAARARIYFNQKKYSKAEKIINEYKDSELFDTTMYRDIVMRDFGIPYYETACKLVAYHQDEANAQTVIETYCSYCEQYAQYKSELNTLMYLLEKLPSDNEKANEVIYQKINRAYLKVTDMQSVEYSRLVDSQLNNSIKAQKQICQLKASSRRRISRIVVSMIITIFIIAILFFVIWQSNLDGLTKIGNRRAFNQRTCFNRVMHIKYAVIMMDIDDFKKVNDTYGHGEGDLVLQRFGQILKSIRDKDVKVYRYGGEEFVAVIKRGYTEKALSIAEYIRQQVAENVWNYNQNITVSLGVADERYSKNSIEEADQNLYYSKCHGKNVVTFSVDGKPSLFQIKK